MAEQYATENRYLREELEVFQGEFDRLKIMILNE